MFNGDMRGQDDQSDLWHLVADDHRRIESFGGARRRHPDVDDHQVGFLDTNQLQQPHCVAGLRHNAVAGVGQQAGHPFPQ